MSIDGFMRVATIGQCPWPDDDMVSYRHTRLIRNISMAEAMDLYSCDTSYLGTRWPEDPTIEKDDEQAKQAAIEYFLSLNGEKGD